MGEPMPNLFLSAVLAIGVVGSGLVAGTAKAADRTFPVSGFTKLKLNGSPDVEVRTGSAASVRATGSSADLERLEIGVRSDELVIGMKSGTFTGWSRDGIKVFVTVPILNAASVSGSGDMSIDRIKAGSFAAAVQGSGNMAVANIDSDKVSLSVNGSGDIRASGRCNSGSYAVNGSGDIDASGLKCQTLSVAVSGSGDVSGHASQTANLSSSGSGDIAIAGGARCTKASRGSGDVRCR